jgi:hypothetical protein
MACDCVPPLDPILPLPTAPFLCARGRWDEVDEETEEEEETKPSPPLSTRGRVSAARWVVCGSGPWRDRGGKEEEEEEDEEESLSSPMRRMPRRPCACRASDGYDTMTSMRQVRNR